MLSFMKMKFSLNGNISQSFIDIGKTCPSHVFLTLFTKINSSENFRIYLPKFHVLADFYLP